MTTTDHRAERVITDAEALDEIALAISWPGSRDADDQLDLIEGIVARTGRAVPGESEGCTCCQVRNRQQFAPDDECPDCGHLSKHHTGRPTA